MTIISNRALSAADDIRAVFDFFAHYKEDIPEEDVIADLTFGNPHEMPLPTLVDVLKAKIQPESVDWFAYKTSEQEPCEVIAGSLGRELGLDFVPEDITMTQGAFGAIDVSSIAWNPSIQSTSPRNDQT